MDSEAYVLKKYSKAATAFELRKFTLPEPKENEVCIEVQSFGLNYADVMARHNKYREAPPLPAILGYDVVGVIISAGENCSKTLIGKRVLAFTRFGAYAKHVNTPLNAIVEIDDKDANKALALSTQYVTSYYMSNYISNIHKKDIVLIHAAAGGVGLGLIQLAKAKGAIVIAKVSSEEKCKIVLQQGADHAINYSKVDYEEEINRILKGKRIQISFNAVAGSTFKKDMRLLGSGGKLILFGGAEMTQSKWGIFSTLNFVRKMGLLLPIALMMKSKSILGVNMLKVADNYPDILSHCMSEVMELEKQKVIQPINGTSFVHSELAKAHELLENGKSIGKISVFW